MEPRRHELSVPRTARYFTHGSLEGAAEVWFVLHGYGQLASTFVDLFEKLATGERLLVAPEALSRFYSHASDDSGTGRVGASWMTSEEREVEVADYVCYLDMLGREVLAAADGIPVDILGFSQGASTAARWAVRGELRPRRLILWGGDLPPELEIEDLSTSLGSTAVVLVAGTDDRFYGPRLEADRARLREAGVEPTVLRFEGGHRLDRATLAALATG